MELNLASECLWRFRNCVIPSMWRLQPHFRFKHELAWKGTDVCIGHAAFKVIWPLQKSGHSYLLHFTEQCRVVLKEVILCLYKISHPTVNQSCQCWATQSPQHCYTIWEVHGTEVKSSIWPLQAAGGSAIASHRPFWASDHIFGSSINGLLGYISYVYLQPGLIY